MSKKSDNKKLIVKETIHDFKENFNKHLHYDFDPNSMIEKFQELSQQMQKTKSPKKREAIINKATDEYIDEIYRGLSLQTKEIMLDSMDKCDRGLGLELSRELEKEFNVKTASEKALIQTATLSYIQYFKLSRALNERMEPDFLSTKQGQFLSIYAKEIDKAYRRFISALQSLKHSRTPPLKVNVKANTAFVANQQQNIANQPTKNETNDPQ